MDVDNVTAVTARISDRLGSVVLHRRRLGGGGLLSLHFSLALQCVKNE